MWQTWYRGEKEEVESLAKVFSNLLVLSYELLDFRIYF
jgi:hypothetical protein